MNKILAILAIFLVGFVSFASAVTIPKDASVFELANQKNINTMISLKGNKDLTLTGWSGVEKYKVGYRIIEDSEASLDLILNKKKVASFSNVYVTYLDRCDADDSFDLSVEIGNKDFVVGSFVDENTECDTTMVKGEPVVEVDKWKTTQFHFASNSNVYKYIKSYKPWRTNFIFEGVGVGISTLAWK
ncbi:MAG: hypothetical protein PHE43_01500 [Candidatus Nanoarchaeia archaeon]|nr:hypothetical protein [Candidatus Nanoarchaeia archaeon]